MSDTQAYKQFGNAVVVPVVQFIANALRPHIEKAIASSSTKTRKRKVAVVTRPDRPEVITAHG